MLAMRANLLPCICNHVWGKEKVIQCKIFFIFYQIGWCMVFLLSSSYNIRWYSAFSKTSVSIMINRKKEHNKGATNQNELKQKINTNFCWRKLTCSFHRKTVIGIQLFNEISTYTRKCYFQLKSIFFLLSWFGYLMFYAIHFLSSTSFIRFSHPLPFQYRSILWKFRPVASVSWVKEWLL